MFQSHQRKSGRQRILWNVGSCLQDIVRTQNISVQKCTTLTFTLMNWGKQSVVAEIWPLQIQVRHVTTWLGMLFYFHVPLLLLPYWFSGFLFFTEVPECLHYDAIMKTPEWQQKALRISLKSLKASGLSKIDKETGLERRTKKQQMEHRRKYTSRLKKTVANTLTASEWYNK